MCRISENSYERFLRSLSNARTYGRTDGGEFIGSARFAGNQKGPKRPKLDFSQNFHLFFSKLNLKCSLNMQKLRRSYERNSKNQPKRWFLVKNGNFFTKTAKTGFFGRNLKTSLPSHWEAPTLCRKSEQSYDRFSRSPPDVRTDVRTDERTWFNRSQPLRGGPIIF